MISGGCRRHARVSWVNTRQTTETNYEIITGGAGAREAEGGERCGRPAKVGVVTGTTVANRGRTRKMMAKNARNTAARM